MEAGIKQFHGQIIFVLMMMIDESQSITGVPPSLLFQLQLKEASLARTPVRSKTNCRESDCCILDDPCRHATGSADLGSREHGRVAAAA